MRFRGEEPEVGAAPVMVGVFAEFQMKVQPAEDVFAHAAGTLLIVMATVLGVVTGRRSSSVGMGPRKMSVEPLTLVVTLTAGTPAHGWGHGWV